MSLLDHLKFEAQQIAIEFEKASLQGKGTPQEVADFRELYFHSFISRYFPLPHKIAKGQIFDSYGHRSDSIDCLVLNPCHPNTVDRGGKFSAIMADGVDLAIEIKPDLSRNAELKRGIKQAQSVKKLRRVSEGIVIMSERQEALREFTKQIPTFIFALEAKKNLVDTALEMREIFKSENIPENEQVDYIVVLNQGIIFNCVLAESCNWVAAKKAVYLEMWEDLTLAAFLMKMNQVFHAVPHILPPVLNHYLANIKPARLGTLNEE